MGEHLSVFFKYILIVWISIHLFRLCNDFGQLLFLSHFPITTITQKSMTNGLNFCEKWRYFIYVICCIKHNMYVVINNTSVYFQSINFQLETVHHVNVFWEFHFDWPKNYAHQQFCDWNILDILNFNDKLSWTKPNNRWKVWKHESEIH